MGLWLAAITAAHALAPEERAIAWETFQATGRNEWQRASRLAALIDDPLPAKTVRWLRMVEDGQPADFATIARFLIDNPHWPWPEQLQTIAEETITDPADHALIRRLFADRPPLTTRGHIRYAEALFDIDQDGPAEALIRKAWIEGDFSPREEQRFLQKYRQLLGRADHIARLDNLLWDYRRNSAKRMIPLVPDGYRRLAEARMRLQRRQGDLDKAIEAVPAELRNDPGLTFDRMRWRRQKQLDQGVLEVLLDPPEEVGRPALWWFERELQIRRALRKRNFELAYQLASRHRQTAGDGFAEAEWLAGWLALRFVHQPNTALRHFNRLYDGVRAPVDRASAAYWAGRSAAALGDRWLAGQWYRRAAEVPIAYYGQLAAEALGEAGQPLPDPPPADPMQHAAFESQELVRVARMLIDADATQELSPFLLRLGEQATSATEVGLVAELAATSGRPHLVAQVGRQTAYYGAPNHVAAFPIPEIAGLMRPPPGDPEPALLMGVGRQESMFNPWVSSHAGARGLLQLIPRTAFLMARQLGLPYNPGQLVGDPDYNVRLGSHYLKTLLKHYDGRGGARRSRLQRGARAGGRVDSSAWRSEARRCHRPDRLDRTHPVRRDPQLRAAGARGAQHVPAPARQRQSGHSVVPPGQRAARATAMAAAEAARRSPEDHRRGAPGPGAAAAAQAGHVGAAGHHSSSRIPQPESDHAAASVQASGPPAPHRRAAAAGAQTDARVMTARMAGIQACVFDAYGTLFDVHSAVGRLRAQVGAHADALSQLWRAKQLEYTWLRALMGAHAGFWQVTGDALDHALARTGVDPAVRERLMQAYLALDAYPEVPETLRRLRAAELKTALLSNGEPGMLAAGAQSAGIDGMLDAILSVEEVGVFKPHPKVYQLAVDRLGVRPDQIAFQSSNAWDVSGAATFGLRAVWINRLGMPPERLPGVAEHELPDLSGLPALLGL